MRIKNAIKKIASLGTGMVMLGATMTGAMAYSLSDYPAPFAESGKYNFLPVYGETSKAADIAGAWDILGGIAGSAIQGVDVEGITITGGCYEEVAIGDEVNNEFGNTLNYRDLDNLQKTEIRFGTDEIDVKDEIKINDGLKVNTIKDRLVLEINKNDLQYIYTFKDEVDFNSISTGNPLNINFLGNNLKIINQQNSDKLIVSKSKDYPMDVGDSETIDGKEVTLVEVGDDSVKVDVDGTMGIINEFQTEIINGVKITVNELFYRTQRESCSAELGIGEDSYVKIRDGDEYFGEDSDEYEWEFDLSHLEDDEQSMGITYAQTRKSDRDDVVYVGSCYYFPDGFARVCLEELDQDYNNYELYYDGNDLIFESNDNDEGFEIGNLNSDKILVNATDTGLYYLDENNNWVNSTTTVKIVNDDAELRLSNDGTNLAIISQLDNITVGYSSKFDSLEYGGKDITGDDNGILTDYGVLIYDVKDNFEESTLDIDVPSQQHKAVIEISQSGIKKTGGQENFLVDTPAPMLKASEISNPEADNLLIVGGPIVNSMAARFIGSDWAFKPGEAIIELKDNGANVALVVAGTLAVDTRRACRVLRDYELYVSDLVGRAVKVTGTSPSFNDITVTSSWEIEPTTTTTTIEEE